jgi:uncharacterized protein
VIFADTSAFYALVDRSDPAHDPARACLESLARDRIPLVTHNYVVVETLALLHRTMGKRVARRWANDLDAVEVDWVDAALHARALDAYRRTNRRTSFVDCVSFELMRERKITHALAFDDDFRRAGFQLVQPA